MRVLMVCTGNLCRSPMAEGFLRHRLAQRGCDDVTVASAGTWAWFGNKATSEAIAVARDRGVDLSGHRSAPLSPEDVAGADLVLAMTSVHVREIAEMVPEHAAKTRLIKELPELEVAASAGPSVAERTAALLAAPRPEPRRDLDLDDPIGLPIGAYERCAGQLDVAIEALARILCPPAPGE